MCVVLLVGRSTIVELVFIKKELSLLGAAPNRQNLKAVIFSSGRLLHPPSPVLPICLQTAELDLLKSSGQSLFSKTFWISIHINELQTLFFYLDLVSRISEFGPILFWSGLF